MASNAEGVSIWWRHHGFSAKPSPQPMLTMCQLDQQELTSASEIWIKYSISSVQEYTIEGMVSKLSVNLIKISYINEVVKS